MYVDAVILFLVVRGFCVRHVATAGVQAAGEAPGGGGAVSQDRSHPLQTLLQTLSQTPLCDVTALAPQSA